MNGVEERSRRNEEDWLDSGPARRSGGIPGWAKFCGCGCLLSLLLVLALGVVLVRDLQRARDQEVQRARLAAVLPFDELPEGFEIFGFPWWVDLWIGNDKRGYVWAFLQVDAKEELSEETFFSGDPAVRDPFFGFQDVRNIQSGELEVQGRKVRVKRFVQSGSDTLSVMTGKEIQSDGASLYLDLTPAGAQRLLLVLIIDVDAREQIPDEEVRELLAPFRVGPDRVPWSRTSPARPTPPDEESQGR
jgi:hypothetical protein